MNYDINKILGAIKARTITFIIGLVIVILCIVLFVKIWENRHQQLEREKAHTAELQATESRKIIQNYIDLANKDHETTTAILDAMAVMTNNINTLADNDKEITKRVNDLSDNEYRSARSQKNDQTAIIKRTAKFNKPVSAREIDALKVDRELYPDK